MLVQAGLHKRIQEAVGRLVSLDNAGETVRISLPVSYPSGHFAVAEVNINGDTCFVTDCALGYSEAEFAAAQSYYGHAARAASNHYGVQYDGMNVFATWASLDRLEGAIVAVANASVQAVAASVLRLATDRERKSNAALFERVADVFGQRYVAKTAELKGKEAQWDAHNVVSLNGRIAVFEFVATHQNSIANKYQMFSDLKESNEGVLSLTSVFKTLDGLGSKGAMLADVSNIMELQAANDDYFRFAKLAA